MDITPGCAADIDQWMEHRTTVLEFMKARSAVCAKDGGRIAGVLLFAREANLLCFLVVAPAYRRRHIAQDLVTNMLERADPQKDVTVSTYRDGDPNGAAARAFYKRLGFQEGPLAEAFGSPVQVFVLKRQAAS